MANETHTITITAKDGTSQTFKTIGAAATKSGQEMERAAQRGADAQKKLQDRLTATGAAVGGLVGITSKLGQAHLSESRQIGALERAYGNQAESINKLADEMQGLGIASDDAVRISALGAQSLARNYGFTADQITKLITVSADLSAVTFDQYGNQLQLADVTQRVAGAMRGEGEAAEILGLNMSDSAVAAEAAARGMTTYGTSMSEAEKAQFRFTLLLEQTASSQGAAGQQADTLAGKVNAMKLGVLDAGSAFGGMLGPAGEAAAVLGDVALAAPLVGGAMGKIAGSAKVAQVGMAALSLATGPVGLVAAAVAGGAAIYVLSQRESEAEAQARRLTDATESYTASLVANTTALVNAGAFRTVDATSKALEEMTINGKIAADRVGLVATAIQDLQEITQAGRLNSGQVVTAEDLNLVDEYVLSLLQVSGALDDGYVSMIELENVQRTLSAGLVVTTQDATALQAALDGLDEAIANPELAGSELALAAQKIVTAVEKQIISVEDGITRLNALGSPEGLQEYNLALRELGKLAAVDATQIALMTGALDSQVVVIEAATGAYTKNSIEIARNKQQRRGLAQDDYWKQQTDDIEAATAAATAFGQSQANRGANAQTPTDPYALTIPSIRAYAEEQNALGLAMREAEQVAIAEAQALLAVSQSMMAAATSGSALDAGIRTILSGTESMTGGIEKVESSLTGLFTVGDSGWSTMDQLLYDNRISQEQYDAALRATTDTQLNNNEAALDAATIQAKQAPILAELAWRQGLYLDSVSQLPAAEQLVALAYQDSARSAQALEIQTQLAAAAAGELGESGKGATKELIRGIAEADPVMAALLEDMGLVSIGTEGTVKINWPEDGQSEMDRLTDALNQLQGTYEVLVGFDINEDGILGWVPPEVPPLPVDADPTPADATVNERIAAWGGLTSTSKHYADTSEGEASVAVRVALWGGLSHTSLHYADTSNADNTVATSVANADAQSATIDIDAYTGPYYANLPATGQVLGTNYIYVETVSLARGIGPHLHGGMVEPAAHGRMPGSAVTLVGETGPELVSLPYGSSVTPASATKARLGNRGGGGGDVYIETLVVQSNDARQLVDTMRGYAIMGARP